MKLAYVAGAYRSRLGPHDHYGILKNIQKAEEVAANLWQMGFAAICPHKNTAFFDGLCDGERFLAGDMEMLKRCDLIVMVPGWSHSRGAVAEWTTAKVKGIPRFEWPKDYDALARGAA